MSYWQQQMTRYRVPEHLRDGLELYLERGIEPGSFLVAVLSNDLMQAMRRADEESRAGLFDLTCFVYNAVPQTAHGSLANVKRWIDEHRAMAPANG